LRHLETAGLLEYSDWSNLQHLTPHRARKRASPLKAVQRSEADFNHRKALLILLGHPENSVAKEAQLMIRITHIIWVESRPHQGGFRARTYAVDVLTRIEG
jgi:hypothetical protein